MTHHRSQSAADTGGAFQDHYSDDVAHCFGCGRLNPHGHQLKSYWDGEETVASFTPESYHTAIPGYVYGGLIASLIDCHGTGTAAAVAARRDGIEPGAEEGTAPFPRFVTAALEVSYLAPTPLGPALELRGKVVQESERKVTTEITVSAKGEITARGRVVAVRMPEHMAGR
jgi:acyl-coenzyme A thioesterase PaaI-like protein